jgi:hypothetical protein
MLVSEVIHGTFLLSCVTGDLFYGSTAYCKSQGRYVLVSASLVKCINKLPDFFGHSILVNATDAEFVKKLPMLYDTQISYPCSQNFVTRDAITVKIQTSYLFHVNV